MPKKLRPAKQVGAVIPNGPPKKSPRAAKPGIVYPDYDDIFRPEDGIVHEGPEVLQPSKLAYRDDARGLYLYHGDCLEVMDTLLAKHPDGVFDLIFADPPYPVFSLLSRRHLQFADQSRRRAAAVTPIAARSVRALACSLGVGGLGGRICAKRP